ncbi:MAG: hypothetical protein ACE5HP_02040 [Gemmatimonadota bacterium]
MPVVEDCCYCNGEYICPCPVECPGGGEPAVLPATGEEVPEGWESLGSIGYEVLTNADGHVRIRHVRWANGQDCCYCDGERICPCPVICPDGGDPQPLPIVGQEVPEGWQSRGGFGYEVLRNEAGHVRIRPVSRM